jgi:hypothetical protein
LRVNQGFHAVSIQDVILDNDSPAELQRRCGLPRPISAASNIHGSTAVCSIRDSIKVPLMRARTEKSIATTLRMFESGCQRKGPPMVGCCFVPESDILRANLLG